MTPPQPPAPSPSQRPDRIRIFFWVLMVLLAVVTVVGLITAGSLGLLLLGL